jgi:hypothetical protein
VHEERRAFLRVETDVAVICTPLAAADERGQPFQAAALNLSAGGAKLRATRPLSPGQRLWLEVRFHSPRFLVFTEATVVRVDDDGFAVAFDELETYTQQRVVRWVYNQDRRLFERHAQARIPLRMRALCRRIAPGGEAVEEFAAPTLDLSLEQVQIRSDRLLGVGAAIDVCLDFEDGQPPFRSRSLVTVAAPDPRMPERFDYRLQLDGAGPAERRRLVERALAAERRASP